MQINLNPPREEIAKWGPLAYVSEEERKNIMNKPCGEFKRWISQLEREIADARKKNKNRTIR